MIHVELPLWTRGPTLFPQLSTLEIDSEPVLNHLDGFLRAFPTLKILLHVHPSALSSIKNLTRVLSGLNQNRKRKANDNKDIGTLSWTCNHSLELDLQRAPSTTGHGVKFVTVLRALPCPVRLSMNIAQDRDTFIWIPLVTNSYKVGTKLLDLQLHVDIWENTNIKYLAAPGFREIDLSLHADTALHEPTYANEYLVAIFQNPMIEVIHITLLSTHRQKEPTAMDTIFNVLSLGLTVNLRKLHVDTYALITQVPDYLNPRWPLLLHTATIRYRQLNQANAVSTDVNQNHICMPLVGLTIKNVRVQTLWRSIWFCVAFHRANATHHFRDSGLPLLSNILTFAMDREFQGTLPIPITKWLAKLLTAKFFQSISI
jgi:hypothetical protein